MNNEWISVKERLPEYDWIENQFIVSTKTGWVCALFFEPGVGFFDGETRDNYWRDCVTHWMPLPEPPNSDNNTNTFSEVSGKVTVGM